jgi:hypothetical protein
MHTESGFAMLTAMGEITREVIETVAGQPGDTPARRLARQQTAASTMASFMPRDPVETMVAGHCVIFDRLLRDSVHDTLCGQPIEMKLRTRNQSHASGKMFLALLDKLEHLQTRLANQPAGQIPVEEATSPADDANTPRATAAAAPAEDIGQHVHADPGDKATVAAKMDAPAFAPNAPTARVPNGAQAATKVAVSTPGSAAAAPGKPPTNAHQDQTHQPTPAIQSAVRQTAVAPAITTLPPTAAPPVSGGPVHARPNLPPEQPKPGTPKPASIEAEHAQPL